MVTCEFQHDPGIGVFYEYTATVTATVIGMSTYIM